jgi:hypothetical protein
MSVVSDELANFGGQILSGVQTSVCRFVLGAGFVAVGQTLVIGTSMLVRS